MTKLSFDCHLTRHHLKHDIITLPFFFLRCSLQISYVFLFSFSNWQTLMLITTTSHKFEGMSNYVIFFVNKKKEEKFRERNMERE